MFVYRKQGGGGACLCAAGERVAPRRRRRRAGAASQTASQPRSSGEAWGHLPLTGRQRCPASEVVAVVVVTGRGARCLAALVGGALTHVLGDTVFLHLSFSLFMS